MSHHPTPTLALADLASEIEAQTMSPAEAAEAVGWEIGTIQQRISRGSIAAVTIGGARRIPRSEVERLRSTPAGWRTRHRPDVPRGTAYVVDSDGLWRVIRHGEGSGSLQERVRADRLLSPHEPIWVIHYLTATWGRSATGSTNYSTMTPKGQIAEIEVLGRMRRGPIYIDRTVWRNAIAEDGTPMSELRPLLP